jgi:hypothetical protein
MFFATNWGRNVHFGRVVILLAGHSDGNFSMRIPTWKKPSTFLPLVGLTDTFFVSLSEHLHCCMKY